MMPNSFQFGTVNSTEEWGLHVISHDFFMPPKRSRKITIPGRSGVYDYGAREWEERTLRLECVLERRISKADFREVVYALSQKKQLRIWDEPDKYYMGALYEPEEVSVYPLELMREFDLNFICEPFAYEAAAQERIGAGANGIRYRGTAPAPPVIVLRNPNSFPVGSIQITIVNRRS